MHVDRTIGGVRFVGDLELNPGGIQGAPADLDWELSEDNDHIVVKTKNFGASLTLKATGSAEDIRKRKVGFTQTVYYSHRFWLYDSNQKTKVVNEITHVPAWDGMSDDPAPWYSGPEEYDEDDQEFWCAFGDAPWMGPLESHPGLGSFVDERSPGEGRTLRAIGGEDSFRLYPAIEVDGNIRLIDGCAYNWHIKYLVRVDGQARTAQIRPGAGVFLGTPGKWNNGSAQLGGGSAESLTSIYTSRWGSLPAWL